MNHINKIYRQADVYYKLSLLKTGIGPEGPTPQEKAILKQYDSYNWTSPAKNLEEFDQGFGIFIKFFEYLSLIPTPAGNPFSYALVGDSLAKGDWVGVAFNILGGLPYFSYLSKAINLAKGNMRIITDLVRAVPFYLRPLVIPILKKIFLWTGKSMLNISIVIAGGHATISLIRGILDQIPEASLKNGVKALALTGFTSKSVQKKPEQFNRTDAVVYLADYIFSLIEDLVRKAGVDWESITVTD